MNREMRQEAERIFQELVDEPPERQAQLLDDRCGSYHALRSEVERLLRATDEVMGEFMHVASSNPCAATTYALERVRVDRIGKFHIERQIGEGGMGLVYAARQDHPERIVALKVLRPGLLSQALLRRFQHEVQALAALQHPNIAHLYEAGTVELTFGDERSHQPFFAMELIHGEPLTDYARRTNSGVPQRLRMLADVCDAVQHAHQKGVIHRDLKPANILVDEAGRPKVLDFGVACVIGADIQTLTRYTVAGQLIGTLAYMSPEQIAGQAAEADTRSDVYSLGVVAFELLTGRLPHEAVGKPIPVAIRTLAEVPPMRLGAVDRRFRGDLEVIVAKALEKEPARRYASAHALSEDIRRFLRNEPIAARPPSTLYYLQMIARRNRAFVGAAALAITSLAVGLFLASYGLAVAAAQRDRADAALANQTLARGEAEAIADFFGKLISAADPRRKGREARVIDLVDAAAAVAETQFADSPLIQARVRHVIGTTYQRLGVYDRGEPHLRYALDERLKRLGSHHSDTLAAMHELAVLYTQWGRYDDAEPLHRRVVDLIRQSPGAGGIALYAVVHELGLLLSRQGRYDEALPLHMESLEQARHELGDDDRDTLTMANNLGLLYRRMGRYNDAIRIYESTFASRERTLGAEHPDTLVSMNNLAHLYRALGRKLESADLHARTLEIRRRVLSEDDPNTVMSMDNLAMLLNDLGRHADAEALFREALVHKRRIYGDDGPETLVTQNNLARTFVSLGRLQEAEDLLAYVLETRERVLGPDHPDVFISINDLGIALTRQGEWALAERHHLRALVGQRRKLGDGHPETLKTLILAGNTMREQGRFAEAEPHFREALDGYRRVLGDDHPDTIKLINNLGALLRDLGQHAEAESLGTEAVERAVRVLADQSAEIAFILQQHARTLAVMGRFGDAEACLRNAYSRLERSQGATHELTLHCIGTMIELYEAWHASEPDGGFDAKAGAWRGFVDETRAPGPATRLPPADSP